MISECKFLVDSDAEAGYCRKKMESEGVGEVNFH